MDRNNLKNYKEVKKTRIKVGKSPRTYKRSNDKFGVFDSSHNISQILKFLPFYERLGLRVVNSKWNLSFYFSECWESLDYRFFDLGKHEFYFNNFRRFIANIKKLDICIDQICGLDKLICSSPSTLSKCVNFISDPGLDFNSDCTVDTSDISETDIEHRSDADLSVLNSNFNDSTNHSNVHDSESTFRHLRNILKVFKNLSNLQISDSCNRNNGIFTRVHPTILKFIESRDFSSDSSGSFDLNNNFNLYRFPNDYCLFDNGVQASGISTLVIDCPVDVHFVLAVIPFVKSIKNLIISRINDDFSICSVISELLEHIPRNQLLSLQVGRTVPGPSFDKVKFSPSARARQINRLNFAYKSFGTTDLDEGDEIISVLLSNHVDSLKILILDDIELSLSAYRKIGHFKNLTYSKIYGWSNLSSVFSLDAF